MNHLQNKGFTLVELMVVIVIMGVLAAVGVPKLTSAVAKSKASEVAPAATTYIKLQSAYVMERKQIGAWKRIGYSKPKSDNFSYDRGDIKSRTKIDDLGEAGLVGWIATNKVSMRDCNQGNTWKVILQQGGTDSDGSVKLNFETEVSDAACAALAGDWTKVSKETQVAATTPEKTYKFVGNQVEMANEVGGQGKIDGKYTLGKAIISGKDSKSSDVNMADYGFTGYVEKQSVSAELKSKLAELVGKDLSSSTVLAYTELYDVPGSEKPSTGIYKGQMNLFYGQNISGTKIYTANLYGHREIYVRYGNGVIQEYCLDETCSQTISKNDFTVDLDEGWISDDVGVNDPFEQVPADMIAASPLSSKTLSISEAPDLVTKLNTNNATEYSVIDDVVGVVISQDVDGNSKPYFNEVNPSPTGSWAAIRVASQIYSENPEPGILYATTLSLYYGDRTTYELKDQRKVYVVTNGTYFYYFPDKECSYRIYVNKDTFWQSDMGKME